jgi:predicted MPP superfamily phosphohydrolase
MLPWWGATEEMHAWPAAAVAVLGGGAVILDLGNRLFGAYRRTPWGATWRVLLVVAAGGAFAVPLLLVLADHPGAGLWAWAAAPVGVAAVAHLFRPFRRAVARVPALDCRTATEPLPERPNLVQSELLLDSLPAELDGLKLLLVSDVHCNTESKLERLPRQLAAAAAREPDLLFVLGDLGDRADLLAGVVEALAAVPARLGAFCVRGNHDFEGGRGPMIADLLADTPIHLLDNRAWTSDRLSLLGVEVPWNPGSLPSGEGFRIALSHTPDNLFALERLGVDLVVSGHTHGGRLWIPCLGPLLVPSRYGTLLARGAYRLNRTTLYITAGLGHSAAWQRGSGDVAELVLRRRS